MEGRIANAIGDLARKRARARTALLFALCCAALGLPGALLAGTTGKVSGRVLDQDGNPVPAATVALLGTPLGAFTDAEGIYNILNVDPGTYAVRVSFIGYKTVTVEDVLVSADQTTRVNVDLRETAIAGEEIVVSARRLPVDLNLTDSRAIVTSDQIEKLPLQDLDDVVNLQAGVIDGHFRGGRLGEVQYQVDGVSINNPYDNTKTLTLDRSVLEEVQVISGTFDAEYGQAMSGVVNAVLKDGTEDFQWNAEVFAGSHVYPGNDNRPVDYKFRALDVGNAQLTASGPTPLAKTVYILNARYYSFNDPYYATRIFVPTDTSDVSQGIFEASGDRKEVPLGYTREWSGLGKISHTVSPDLKFGYQAVFNIKEGKRDDYEFWATPDARTTQNTYAVNHGFDWNQTFSRSTFLDVNLRHNHFHYRDLAYDDVYDPRYDEAGPLVRDPILGAYVIGGIDLTRFEQRTNTYTAKASLSSQVTAKHLIKAGGELSMPRLEFGSPGYLVVNPTTGRELLRKIDEPPDYPPVSWYRPVIGVGFFQDQVEWEGLTLRAGLRIDYFSARTSLPSDLQNPASSIQGAPPSELVATTAKTNVSPRLGVAYPFGYQAALQFSYGHFYQYPSLRDIFTNADYSTLKDLQAGGARYEVMGNPDIEAEKTVQYQIGYKQALTPTIGLEATTFYKDIRDLLGVEFITTYNNAEYARWSNGDFGRVVGVTVKADLQELGPTAITVDYTWQQATGNTSDPRETATRAEANEDPRPRLVPFNWDQRHTVNATIALVQPAYSLSSIIRVASGQPYTPALETGGHGLGLNVNSGRKPSAIVVDLRAEVPVRALGNNFNVFGRVFNLFDAAYFNGAVFETSGSPYYSRFPGTDIVTLSDPTRLYEPRRIEIGIRLGTEGL